MKRRITVIFVLLLTALGVFFGYKYYLSVYLPTKRTDEAYGREKELIERMRPEPRSVVTSEKSTENEEQSYHSEPDGAKPEGAVSDPLDNAERVNPDCVGWIYIPGTSIDFPVMQSGDNDFYLHNGADGTYNHELGCPFLDWRCESDFSGFNSIVYGHHINGGRMFADISLFSDEDFFKSHTDGVLTLRDGDHAVEFIAYLNVCSTSPAYHASFVSPSDREAYIDYIVSQAKFLGNVSADSLKADDDLHLLLLSTCTYEFDDARGVLVGIIN